MRNPMVMHELAPLMSSIRYRIQQREAQRRTLHLHRRDCALIAVYALSIILYILAFHLAPSHHLQLFFGLLNGILCGITTMPMVWCMLQSILDDMKFWAPVWGNFYLIAVSVGNSSWAYQSQFGAQFSCTMLLMW